MEIRKLSKEVPADEPLLAELLDILRDTEEPCRQVGPVDVLAVLFVLTVMLLIRNAEVEGEEGLESAEWKEENEEEEDDEEEEVVVVVAVLFGLLPIFLTILEIVATELELATAVARSGISGSKFLG